MTIYISTGGYANLSADKSSSKLIDAEIKSIELSGGTYSKDVIENLSKLALGNSGLIGFRIPKHEFTNELVSKFKKPIITTSLNVTKKESITDLKTASIDFKDLVIFDDEINRDSKGSTILDFSSDIIKIIRYGDEIYKKWNPTLEY